MLGLQVYAMESGNATLLMSLSVGEMHRQNVAGMTSEF
jgi:hypothetical protein